MPEYETIFALGPMLGIANPEALILANDLCDLLGMDTISMGVTLAFVAEALERGWLDQREVGVPFGWGDWRGMLRLVEMTGAPRGLRRASRRGRLAAGGVGASRGDEARVRGQGARAARPTRRARSRGSRSATPRRPAAAATTTRGRRRSTRQGFDRRGTSDKPAFAVRSQHFTALGDSLVMCRFTSERGFGLFIGEPYASDGPRDHRLGRDRRGARARRRAHHQPRAAVQRPRGRAPRPGRAARGG